MVPQTLFGRVISRQFEAIRDGDRFFFENKGNGLFSDSEIAAISSTSLADVIQRNTDITGLSNNVFYQPTKEIKGGSDDDYFVGEAGNVTYTAGDGYDTMDYSRMDTNVRLVRGGTVEKGRFGTDSFKDFVEEVVATENDHDWIDAGTGKDASIDVDLANNSLKVSGIPGVGEASFDVYDFEHVKGSENADTIKGNSSDNQLLGEAGKIKAARG